MKDWLLRSGPIQGRNWRSRWTQRVSRLVPWFVIAKRCKELSYEYREEKDTLPL